jgi:hypothetical protein
VASTRRISRRTSDPPPLPWIRPRRRATKLSRSRGARSVSSSGSAKAASGSCIAPTTRSSIARSRSS